MKIIAIDISGNFEEGKGTTGYCIGDDKGNIIEIGEVKASDYTHRMKYTDAVFDIVFKRNNVDIIVCENFRLYAHKAKAQIHSLLETPRIIGALEYLAWKEPKPIYFQMASEVKKRFSDDIMLNNNILQKYNPSSLVNTQNFF